MKVGKGQKQLFPLEREGARDWEDKRGLCGGNSGPQVPSWQMRLALVAVPRNWESKLLCSVGPPLDLRGACVLSGKSLRCARAVGEDLLSSKGMRFPGFVPWLIRAGSSPGNLEITPSPYCKS